MKKILKVIVFTVVFMFSFFITHTKIEAATASCDSLTSEDAKAACKNVEDYCQRGVGGDKGCVYDPNSSKYNQVNNISNSNGTRGTFTSGKANLVRGYSAVDKNGYALFAGCYIYQNPKAQGGFFPLYMQWPKGTYYIFMWRQPDKNGDCTKVYYDIVPAGTFGNFDGRNAIGIDGATYKWTAKQNGSCPLIMAVTGNPTALTAHKNQFLFTDNQKDVEEYDKKQFRFDFWNIEHYEMNYGCTVEDVEGFNAAIGCYENTIKDIKNMTCPSDLTDISSYVSTLDGLADKCSSDFEILYSNEYLNKNADIFTKNLTTSANEKITKCQYQSCNLSAGEIDKLAGLFNPSDKTTDLVCREGCALKDTQVEYDSCIKCINNVLDKSGISKTKKECILSKQEAVDEAIKGVSEVIKGDQAEHVEAELAESQKIREDLYSHYEDPLGIGEPEMPGEEITECDRVLGENLYKVVTASVTILQIVAAIIAIVKGMMTLLPPIIAHDADALKKAGKTLATMAIILVIIFLFKPLLGFLGDVIGFDTSCIA